MSIDAKLDRLIRDVEAIKATHIHHTKEITEIKEKLAPVFEHVNGMKWLFRAGGALLSIGALLMGIFSRLNK